MLFNRDLDYETRMNYEIKHYEKIFKGRLSQEVPPVWNKVEEHFANCIQKHTNVRNLYQYVAEYVKEKKHISILGLGSGACGNELDGIAPLLIQKQCEVELTCVDINEEALKQAKIEANKRGIQFEAIKQDINKLKLDKNRYDVIVAYAALHHFIELDSISKEICNGLGRNGLFVTVDIPTKNGYKMWDETYDIICSIWNTLPPKFKIDHTGFIEPQYMEKYENIDYSINSFECINSEAILPALQKNLQEICFVPALSISRRFFDTKFGPNYNLNEKLDLSIFEFIINLDTYFIETQILKPETFFGAYIKKT